MKNSKTGNSIAPWTLFLFCMAMFYMQYKGREKAAKVVEFVAKWLNLCLSTVPCFDYFDGNFSKEFWEDCSKYAEKKFRQTTE